MNYQIKSQNPIGRGANGEVFLAKDLNDGSIHVIKKLRMRNISEHQRITIQTELKLLKEFKHVNIVPFRDSFIDADGNLNIVMAYCEGGDMHNLIEDMEGKKFSEKKIIDWVIQLALSILYLHERRILHRDIKTQNIFLTQGSIMLGDFGVSKVLDQAADLARTNIGTPYYMSPEQYRQKPYSYKSDIWAFGCIIYEMCNHKHVFEAMNINALAVKVMKGAYSPVSQCYSHNLRSLVDQMLSQTPKQRPSIIEILKKPFLLKNVRKYMRDIYSNKDKYEKGQIESLKGQAKLLGIQLEQDVKKKSQNTPSKTARKSESKYEKSRQKLRENMKKDRQKKNQQLKKFIVERNKVQEQLRQLQKGSPKVNSERHNSDKKISKKTHSSLSSRETPNKAKSKVQHLQPIVKNHEKQKKKIIEVKKQQVIAPSFKIEEQYDMDYQEYSDKQQINPIDEKGQWEEWEVEEEQLKWKSQKRQEKIKIEKQQVKQKIVSQTEVESERRNISSHTQDTHNERQNEQTIMEKLQMEVKERTIMITDKRNQISKLDFVISSDSQQEDKLEKKEVNPSYARIMERVNDLKQKILAQLGRITYNHFMEFIQKQTNPTRDKIIKIVGEDKIGVWHIADAIIKLGRVLNRIPMYQN